MFKNVSIFIFLIISAFFLCGCEPMALRPTPDPGVIVETDKGGITGNVLDFDSLGPISDATVTLSLPSGTSTAATNLDGWFSFGNLSAPSVGTITISKSGYVTTITSIDVVAGQTAHHEYLLSAAPTPSELTPSSGGTYSDSLSHVIVTVPSNALTTAAGELYTQTV